MTDTPTSNAIDDNSDNELSNDDNSPIEVAVGVFDSQDQVNKAAIALRANGLNVQRVSLGEGMPSEMPDIVYDDVEEISPQAVAKGAISGGAIGVGSGLLLMGVPVINVLAPIAAGLAGAWIGAIAGADETNRAVELPGQAEYRELLAKGKSFLVAAGTEKERLQYAIVMKKQGALEIHQHPPTRHIVRSTSTS